MDFNVKRFAADAGTLFSRAVQVSERFRLAVKMRKVFPSDFISIILIDAIYEQKTEKHAMRCF